MKKNKTNIVDKKVLIKDTSSSYSEAFQQLQVNLDFSFITIIIASNILTIYILYIFKRLINKFQ